jgi:hypothetical protein
MNHSYIALRYFSSGNRSASISHHDILKPLSRLTA